LEASKHRETHPDAVDSFLEELVVRRELADNFCLHNPHYDSVLGAPGWARESLALHATDAREFEYTLAEMERSETHDELWNAAQKELAHLGTMHGFMRMYWAKKILEWTGEGPEEALRRAIYLNDRYQLDGRDPNGYVGCMWAVCGVHDQGWKERDVFGKVRYMNYAGCKRKFKIAEYVQRVEREVAGELAAREARAARRESREGSIA
jgi:deoxyribodipyrimidine photo-lyase